MRDWGGSPTLSRRCTCKAAKPVPEGGSSRRPGWAAGGAWGTIPIHSLPEDTALDRNTFDNSLLLYKQRSPFRPFMVIMVSGDRLEVDHGGALGVRDGVALYVAPGGVPIAFDHEGVSHIIGDLASSHPANGGT